MCKGIEYVLCRSFEMKLSYASCSFRDFAVLVLYLMEEVGQLDSPALMPGCGLSTHINQLIHLFHRLNSGDLRISQHASKRAFILY